MASIRPQTRLPIISQPYIRPYEPYEFKYVSTDGSIKTAMRTYGMALPSDFVRHYYPENISTQTGTKEAATAPAAAIEATIAANTLPEKPVVNNNVVSAAATAVNTGNTVSAAVGSVLDSFSGVKAAVVADPVKAAVVQSTSIATGAAAATAGAAIAVRAAAASVGAVAGAATTAKKPSFLDDLFTMINGLLAGKK